MKALAPYIKLNPLSLQDDGTGAIEYASSVAAPPPIKVETIQLSAGDITNKYKDLALVPTDATNVMVALANGSVQVLGIDYTVITDGSNIRRVNWDTLPMQSLVSALDYITILYDIALTPSVKMETIQLSAGDITAKFKDLANTPATPANVWLALPTGSVQVLGTDYTLTTDGFSLKRINWNTLPLQSLLSALDYIVVIYDLVVTPTFSLEEKLITPTHISNKYFDLAATPTNASNIVLALNTGSVQTLGVDYQITSDGITNKRIEWSGMGLDGMISATDYAIVLYDINPVSFNTASNQVTDVSGFNRLLSGTDTNLQLALDTLDDKALDRTKFTPAPVSVSSGVTLNLAAKFYHKLATTGNITSWTLNTPTAGDVYLIEIVYGGAHTVAAIPGILWSGGIAPTFTSVSTKKDVITLFYDGIDYLGSVSLNY